jgi:nitroimidazol reductase NimA-like FMN-containing flavoprotein (pyridoxamine 5'-phosphate oxidase superfamily)
VRLNKKMNMNNEAMEKLLHKATTGRLATIDTDGFPIIIPLNFVLLNQCIYFHSATIGEKLDNIRRNLKVGFEVDQYIVTLPCYYFEGSQDPSETDTLYRSVVIRGISRILEDNADKVLPLQRLMEKYQPEGGYTAVDVNNLGLQHAAVVEIVIENMTGKEKIGQHWPLEKRLAIARKIYDYHPQAHDILSQIGIVVHEDRETVQLSLANENV